MRVRCGGAGASDYYILFGHPARRRWEDGRRFGFIAGGGAPVWSRRLRELVSGDGVFVHVHGPGPHGYVAIGRVVEPAVRVEDFIADGQSLLDRTDLVSPGLAGGRGDDDVCEWIARVAWEVAVPVQEAYWRRGLFHRRSINVVPIPWARSLMQRRPASRSGGRGRA
jgi:hypothetical protein